MGDRPPLMDQMWQTLLRFVLVLVALRIALSLIAPVLPLLIVLAVLSMILMMLLRRHG